MRLAYIDESITKTHCFVGAILVGDHSAPALDSALEQVAQKAHRDFLSQLPEPPELHGYQLFHGSGEWSPLRGKKRALVSIYRTAMKEIGQQDVHLFFQGIDIASHRDKYGMNAHPEYDVVFSRLLERLNEFVTQKNETVLVISDMVAKRNDHRRDLKSYKLNGTIGYRSSRLSNIIDTIHYVPSEHSRIIQAIDPILYLRNRMESVKINETDPRELKARREMWKSLEPRIYHDLCQYPNS